MPSTFLLPLFLPAWNPGKTPHTRKHKAVVSQDPTDLLLKWSFYESNSVLNVQRSVLTELLFPKKSLWVWHLARPNGVPGSWALMTCRCGVALWKSCLVPDGVWGKGRPVPAEDMGTVADWAGWEEGEEKRGALGKTQVKRKELWIHWKPPGRTLKTDKGKIKQTKQRRGSLGNSRSISCYHESPHLLSIWCRDGPGLNDLTTFSLFSSFVAEQILLLIINRKPELESTAATGCGTVGFSPARFMRNRSWKKATPQDSETTSPQQSQRGQGLSKGCFSPKAEARRRPKLVEAKNCRPSSTKLIDGYLLYLDSWTCSWTLSLAFGQGSLGRFSLYKVLNASLWLWRITKDNYPKRTVIAPTWSVWILSLPTGCRGTLWWTPMGWK